MKSRSPRLRLRHRPVLPNPERRAARASAFGCRVAQAGRGVLAAVTFLALDAARAQSTNKIPDLRPPQDLIPPPFWERHGSAAGILGLALVALALLLFFWRRRARPVELPPPAAIARRTLEPLRDRTPDESIAALTAQTVRRYAVSAFGLAQAEPTTDELLATLQQQTKLPSALLGELGGFLRGCDAARFASAPDVGTPQLVPAALELVDQLEAARRPPTPA